MNKHIDPDILKRIEEQEKRGGIKLDELEVGTIIEAQTQNTLYRIEVLSSDKFLVEGGQFFSEPTETSISGSTWGGSMLKLKWLGIGMHIDMPGCLTTAVKSLKVIAPDGSWAYGL